MCALLPWWDAWVAPAMALFVVLVLAVPSLELLRRHAVAKLGDATSAPWTERARRAFELRQLGLASATSWTVLAAVECEFARSASGCSHAMLVATAGGVLIVGFYLRLSAAIQARYEGRTRPLGARLKSLATLLVVVRPSLLVTIVAVLASGLAPRGGHVWGWVLGVAALLYASGAGIFYGLARGLGLVRPARAEVVRAVERAREQLPTQVRGVDEMAWLMPNALAHLLRQRVAFTVAAAEQLSFDDLHAIALHELGHLHESAWLRWLRPAQGLALLPVAVGLPLVQSDEQVALLALTVLSLALSVLALRLSRKHENEADAHAVAHSGAYATALENLYRLAGIPAVLSKRATHPSLYDRMQAAGVTPSYPRPKPPRRGLLPVVLLATLVLCLGLEVGRSLERAVVLRFVPRPHAAYLRVALDGSPGELWALAQQVREAQPELAEPLMQRAYDLEGARH